MSPRHGPPRLSQAVLAWVLRSPDGEFVLGDIEEDWRALTARQGRAEADRWYRRQVWSTVGAWALRAVRRWWPGPGGRRAVQGNQGSAGPPRGGGGGVEGMMRDVRYAFRGLVMKPGFTALVVATLTLGIGANTAIFSVVHAVMLRSLPYPESHRLVDVAERVGNASTGRIPTSVATYREWRDGTSAFEALEAASPFRRAVLTGLDEALRLRADLVTPGFLGMMGARTTVGRMFRPEEGEQLAGDHQVVVLSHGLWQRAFGTDSQVVGRAINLSGTLYTVVGVLDESFREPFPGSEAADVYLPITELERFVGGQPLEQRLARLVQVVGLLRPDRTLAQAHAELEGVTAGIRAAEPEAMGDTHVMTQPLRDRLLGNLDAPLLALLAGAVFLLIVGCINVASLMLVRGAARGREVAVRLALGAPRARLIRQLTTEALVLAVLGGIGGVLMASVTLDLILQLNATAMPDWVDVRLDGAVLAASLGLSLVTGVAFGLLPALRTTRSDLRSALTVGDVRSGGPRPFLGRHTLVVVEVATAMVLMVGSGLMIRSFQALRTTDMGFRTEGVLSAMVSLPGMAYTTPGDVEAFREGVLTALNGRPGVTWAHLWGPGRPGQVGQYGTLLAEGMVATSQLDAPLGRTHNVTPGALEAMEIPLLAGRTFDRDDRAGSQPVIILSEGFARRLFGGEDAIGRRVGPFVPPGVDPAMFPPMEVVGVVADAELAGRSMTGTFDVPHDMYFPVAQRGLQGTRSLVILLATSGDPSDAAPLLREAVREVDPDVPLSGITPMPELVDQELVTSRFVAVLMGIFGALSLFLAGLGIYGVLSQSVSARRREVGLRSALGAQAGSTVRLFVGYGVRLTLLGIGAGLLASLALTRFVSTLLYGVAPNDPLTLVATSAVLFVVALLAAYLPTRRALRVSPIVALRSD